MKYLIVLLLGTASLIACKSSDKNGSMSQATKDSLTKDSIIKSQGQITPPPPQDTANFTDIEWLDSTYLDLGKRKEGKEIEISFRFKNTGNKNLVIENVTAQCGCTIPEKPEKAFAPGEEGVIKAKFNGSGHDETRKQVYVKANIRPYGSDTLTFRTQLVK
jgi:Protein of unknown function (DUF1573)